MASDPMQRLDRSILSEFLVPVVVLLVLHVLVVPSAGAQTSFNMELVSHLPMPISTDVSSEGDLVFVGRSGAGVSIVDVSNVATPVLLTTWQHPTQPQVTNDVRPLGNHLYVSNETGGPVGLFVLDLSVPASPSLVTVLGTMSGFPPNVHNLWAEEHYLYLSGTGPGGGNFIVDVLDPAAPEIVTNIEVGLHDNTLVGNLLYTAGGFDGLYLFDITDRANPVQLSHYSATTPDTSYYAHNAWPIDERYLLLGEEVQLPPAGFGRGSFRVVDFADPANPAEVFRWYSENAKDNSNITVHNVYVIGGFAYISYYRDGVRILDVSDPLEPVEVAWYDTFPEPAQSLFEGCWGVYPFQGNDRIFASDRTHGLFVLRFNGARKSTLQGKVLDAVTLEAIPGAGVKTLTGNRSTLADGNGDYRLMTGSGVHQVRVTAAGFHPLSAEVVLADLGTTAEDFLLVPANIAVEEPPPAGAGRGAPALILRASPNPAGRRPGLQITVPPEEAGEPLELAVYSVDGVRLRALASGIATAGSQSIRWDGRDEVGRRLAPGVYLVRLRLGRRVATEKVVLGP
jgi:choice-of-anchor B domain-containing protein